MANCICDTDICERPRPAAAPAAAAPPPRAEPTSQPAQPPQRVQQDAVPYPVYYATNRVAKGKLTDCSRDFAVKPDEISRSQTVIYGKCTVNIPPDHIPGTVEQSLLDKILKRNADLYLDPTHESFGENFHAFEQAVKRRLKATTTPGEKSVLVFIHGFNTNFQEAILRAAQLGFDLNGPESVTAAYVWPSSPRNRDPRTLPFGYIADEATITASEHLIADFLVRIATATKPEKVHIIAHSMGNRGLLHGLVGAAGAAQAKTGIRFGQIFLAAPDVDLDVFWRLAKIYPQVADGTTVYISKDDRALGISEDLHAYPRAGNTPPSSSVNHVDVVDITEHKKSMWDLLGSDTAEIFTNHAKFATLVPLICDMKQRIGRMGAEQRGHHKSKGGHAYTFRQDWCKHTCAEFKNFTTQGCS